MHPAIFLYRKIILRLCLYMSMALLAVSVPGQEQVPVSFRSGMPDLPGDTNAILEYISAAKRLPPSRKETASDLLGNALEGSRRILYNKGVQESAYLLAKMLTDKEQYVQAVAFYEKNLRDCLRYPGLHEAASGILNNIGNIYVQQGNFDSAIVYYKRALQLSERLGLHSPWIYNNLGGIFIQTGQAGQALYYLDKGEQIALAANDHFNLINIYGNKISYYFEAGDWDQSILYAGKALTTARQYGTAGTELQVLANLGELYRRKGQPDKALPYLLEAKALKEKASPYYYNHLLTVLGNTYLDMKQYRIAERYLLEALSKSREAGLKQQMIITYGRLSDIYLATGDYKKSLEYYKISRQVKDSIEQQEMKNKLAEWDIKYQNNEKDKALALKQLHIKNKNAWLMGISAASLLLVALVIILFNINRINKHKNNLQAREIDLLRREQEIVQLKATIRGEEKERARIARELHDGVGGMLAAINMNLSDMWKKQQDPSGRILLEKILRMVKDTGNEVRKTSHNLLPDVLTRHNLEEALLVYCEQVNIENTLKIAFQYHVDIEGLDKSTELVLYRISQELLQNILKHSKASAAWIMIKQLNQKLSIIVEDNGVGFDPGKYNNGYGLLNLEHRVKALEGTLDIVSTPDHGTTIHIEFDIDNLKKKSLPV